MPKPVVVTQTGIGDNVCAQLQAKSGEVNMPDDAIQVHRVTKGCLLASCGEEQLNCHISALHSLCHGPCFLLCTWGKAMEKWALSTSPPPFYETRCLGEMPCF